MPGVSGVSGHRRGLARASAVVGGGEKVGDVAALRGILSVDEDEDVDDDAIDVLVPRRTSCLRPATGDMEAKRADEKLGELLPRPMRSGVAGGEVGVGGTELGSW